MQHIDRRAENDGKLFTVLMVALIAVAWLALAVWGQSPYGRFLNHQHLDEVSLGDSAVLLVFVAGWTLMTAAMMLPTSLPLVTLFHRLVQRRPNRTGLVVLLITGYLGVWTVFGAVVHLGDWGLHHAVERLEWLHDNSWVIGAATLLLAGVYQFTPLKYRCLDRCRSPLSFVVEHWRGRHEQAEALWLGAASRHLLPGLLLVADATHVRRRRRQSRLDAGPRAR